LWQSWLVAGLDPRGRWLAHGLDVGACVLVSARDGSPVRRRELRPRITTALLAAAAIAVAVVLRYC
jgi:hypothetical protein